MSTPPSEFLQSDAAAPARWDAVLDAQALGRLRELDPTGRNGLVVRVLTTYVSSLSKLLDQFEAARAAADAGGLRHVAHTLKSSSASVGALQLSALCADAERSLRDGPQDGLEPQLDALAAEARRVHALLEAGVAEGLR